MRELELYLHIPFCVRKCAYCDFLSFPAPSEEQAAYLQALKGELAAFDRAGEYRVSTVFFGGGTPSLLPAEKIEDLLDTVRQCFLLEKDAEISIECNPGTADASKLRRYRRAGINRISFGLQSADEKELRLLGRIHTWGQFLQTYEAAREAGFDNINVDLMSALPGQTVFSWEKTLEQVAALRPEHISAYSLIIEEGTPFYEAYHEDVKRRDAGDQPGLLPSEEEERQMYRRTGEILSKAGMHRYEISNYALPGRECRHNIGYWNGTEYAGFGLGAASLLENVRFRNPEGMQQYLAGDFSLRERQELTLQDQMEEFMFLGLRMTEGVSEEEFQKRFGRTAEAVYGKTVKKLQEQKLLERVGGRIRLSPRGTDLANFVMASFLL